MFTVSEAQLTAWLSPLIWPFLRVLAMFTSAPVLGLRSVPVRVKVALAFFIAVAAQASLPEAAPIALDSARAVEAVAQSKRVGLALGFAARVVFAGIEVAGAVIGLQMGLNFASFFDPLSATQSTAVSRFFGTSAAWLFILMNGHRLLTAAVIQSFHSFPVGVIPNPKCEVISPRIRWIARHFARTALDHRRTLVPVCTCFRFQRYVPAAQTKKPRSRGAFLSAGETPGAAAT